MGDDFFYLVEQSYYTCFICSDLLSNNVTLSLRPNNQNQNKNFLVNSCLNNIHSSIVHTLQKEYSFDTKNIIFDFAHQRVQMVSMAKIVR